MPANEALLDEVRAICFIYNSSIVTLEPDGSTLLLKVPNDGTVLSLRFPVNYPVEGPSIYRIYSTPDGSSKGHGIAVLALATKALAELASAGQEVMYELIVRLEELLLGRDLAGNTNISSQHDAPDKSDTTGSKEIQSQEQACSGTLYAIPTWIFSQPAMEKKSQFIARVCRVDSKEQAIGILSGLVASDKRLTKASHNISAYRILASSTLQTRAKVGNAKRVIADCDDDGESAAGGRLAHLLQMMKVGNVLIVVSRWYGGIKLGPDRFRIINQVAREAILAGGWVKGGRWEADVGF